MAWNVCDDRASAAAPAASPMPRCRSRLTEPNDHEHNDDHQATGFSHEKIETNNFLMIVLILLVVAIGGLVEIVPLFFQSSTTQPVAGPEALHGAAAGRAATSTCARAATTATRR